MKSAWYWFIAWAARCVFGLLGGIRITGLENVPKSGPVLLAPIHVSHLDPPLVGCSSPRQLRFMAKEELFRVPVLAPLIRSLGAYPIKRGETDSATIRRTIEWLQAGAAVLVFPEGSRGDGEKMQAIQTGVSILAKRTGAQVVPVGLAGTLQKLPRGKTWPNRTPVAIHYAPAFTWLDVATSGNERQDRQAFVDELGRRIAAACAEAGFKVRSAD